MVTLGREPAARRGITRCAALAVPLLALTSAGSFSADRVGPVPPATAGKGAIVVQNFYYARRGKADEVYRWRMHASEVRARLGLAVGRVLRRTPASENNADDVALPDVVWECEYPNAAARAADIAKLGETREFEAVEAHMSTLIREFRRVIFQVAAPD